MPETFHSSEQVQVFILYLLEKIGYPLEYNDLASIVLRDGYVDYFDFVKNFHDLLEKGHIRAVETEMSDDSGEDSEEAEENETPAEPERSDAEPDKTGSSDPAENGEDPDAGDESDGDV